MGFYIMTPEEFVDHVLKDCSPDKLSEIQKGHLERRKLENAAPDFDEDVVFYYSINYQPDELDGYFVANQKQD